MTDVTRFFLEMITLLEVYYGFRSAFPRFLKAHNVLSSDLSSLIIQEWQCYPLALTCCVCYCQGNAIKTQEYWNIPVEESHDESSRSIQTGKSPNQEEPRSPIRNMFISKNGIWLHQQCIEPHTDSPARKAPRPIYLPRRTSPTETHALCVEQLSTQ